MTERNIMASIAKNLHRLVCGLFSFVLATCYCVAPASALSKEEIDAVSSNCSTIKQTLTQLQKVDSRTRTYLGTTYETIVNKFITPLNLRLVRNNRPTLSDIQSDFSNEQLKFRENYTNYMREMESLVAMDCQAEPERFYEQLVKVRERRAKVRISVESLKKLTEKQYQSVVKLRQELDS